MGARIKWAPDKESLAFITKRIKDGATQATISKELGFTPGTLSEYKKKYPEIEEAIKSAKCDVESEVVGKLMSIIRDDNHKGQLTSIIFYLKTQCRWRETPQSTVEVDVPLENAPFEGFKITVMKKNNDTE